MKRFMCKRESSCSLFFISLFFIFFLVSTFNGYTNENYGINEIWQNSMLIRGKIIDQNGQPLPGANVLIEGTSKGTITDTDGYYVIEAEKGDILIYSFIGFQEQKVTVGDNQAIDITLVEETTVLDEAVVVGMGVQRKASVIGAISTVETNAIVAPQRSLVSALSGRVAGATIVQRSGEPGYDEHCSTFR